MDDRELEQAMRDGLDRRAQRADVAVPVADRARTDVRRRRAGRLIAGLAAVAVVAAGVTVATLDRGSDRDQEPTGPPVAIDSGPTADGTWRTEYWRDLQVEVPDTWGWGASPPASCVGAARSAGGRPVESDFAEGYVGRPIVSRRVCSGPPPGPYVWLGADRPVGVLDLGGGYVEETVEVNGSTLTVASDDAALRARILASATGGETCMSDLDVRDPSFPKTVPGDVWREADVLNVCVYQQRDHSVPADLVYATTLDIGRLHAYLGALEEGEEPRDQCPTLDYTEGEWVVLEIGTEDGDVFRRDAVHLFCPGIDVDAETLSGLETVRLTEAMLEPWAVEGVGAVVQGPLTGDLAELGYFIGPLGPFVAMG
ncbi:MAG: hypothetical protein Q7J48_03765 [Nocardioides sp.]|nr:hypothetical protein [Nocardioides sp.]